MDNTPENVEEKNDTSKIENTIYDMLDKVMEEKDTLNSFDFGDDEIEEEALKISRYSTRHQTTDFQPQHNFNRHNKRNLTDILNNKNSSDLINTMFSSSNEPLMEKSFFYLNNNNIYSRNHENVGNNISRFNNNLNQSSNNQYNKNTNINNNFIRNHLPGSKTVVYNLFFYYIIRFFKK